MWGKLWSSYRPHNYQATLSFLSSARLPYLGIRVSNIMLHNPNQHEPRNLRMSLARSQLMEREKLRVGYSTMWTSYMIVKAPATKINELCYLFKKDNFVTVSNNIVKPHQMDYHVRYVPYTKMVLQV